MTDSQAEKWQQLGQGLYLEHLDLTLEWRTTHRQARSKLGFEDRRPSADTLVWNRVECLGGLQCDQYAKFIPDDGPTPEQRTLRLIEFTVHAEQPVEHLYEAVKAHLVRLLGAPTLEYDGHDGNLRSFVEWDSEKVMVLWKIMGGARQGCVGELWSKPLPKEYLKLTLA